MKEVAKKTIEKKSLFKTIDDFLINISPISLQEKLFFIQHLGVMLRAGISLITAIRTIAAQSRNKRFVRILNKIAAEIENGSNFADSLRPYEKIFGEVFVNMISAGEISGKLESILMETYIQTKKRYEISAKIKGALLYPTVVFVAMISISTFIVLVVLPQTLEMLKGFDAPLPLATKILIAVVDFIRNHGVPIALSFIGIIALLWYLNQTKKGKYYFQLLWLKMPIVGEIIKKINLANFSRNLSSLLRADIMIIKAFEVTANAMSNVHYKKAILDMQENLQSGGQVNEVIKTHTKLFPPIIEQMILVGEQTGELSNVLEELAEFYEGEVNQIMNSLPSIIEPILIIVLGIAVACIAVAIMMPMYSMTSAI